MRIIQKSGRSAICSTKNPAEIASFFIRQRRTCATSFSSRHESHEKRAAVPPALASAAAEIVRPGSEIDKARECACHRDAIEKVHGDVARENRAILAAKMLNLNKVATWIELVEIGVARLKLRGQRRDVSFLIDVHDFQARPRIKVDGADKVAGGVNVAEEIDRDGPGDDHPALIFIINDCRPDLPGPEQVGTVVQ